MKQYAQPLASGAFRKLVPAVAVVAALSTVMLFTGSATSAQTQCGSGNYSTRNMDITISKGNVPCSIAIGVMETFLGRSHPSFEARDDARIEYFTREVVNGRAYDKDKYIFHCEYFKPTADHNYKFGGECEGRGTDSTEGVFTARPKA